MNIVVTTIFGIAFLAVIGYLGWRVINSMADHVTTGYQDETGFHQGEPK